MERTTKGTLWSRYPYRVRYDSFYLLPRIGLSRSEVKVPAGTVRTFEYHSRSVGMLAVVVEHRLVDHHEYTVPSGTGTRSSTCAGENLSRRIYSTYSLS